MLDSDELDNETLQARIDLSMAHAHELVSSWIKPSLKSSLETRRETDRELEEYMRRPPRYREPSLNYKTTKLKKKLNILFFFREQTRGRSADPTICESVARDRSSQESSYA
jgi:hypothetical protein